MIIWLWNVPTRSGFECLFSSWGWFLGGFGTFRGCCLGEVEVGRPLMVAAWLLVPAVLCVSWSLITKEASVACSHWHRVSCSATKMDHSSLKLWTKISFCSLRYSVTVIPVPLCPLKVKTSKKIPTLTSVDAQNTHTLSESCLVMRHFPSVPQSWILLTPSVSIDVLGHGDGLWFTCLAEILPCLIWHDLDSTILVYSRPPGIVLLAYLIAPDWSCSEHITYFSDPLICASAQTSPCTYARTHVSWKCLSQRMLKERQSDRTSHWNICIALASCSFLHLVHKVEKRIAYIVAAPVWNPPFSLPQLLIF